MREAPITVYIVDDDAAIRDSLTLLLSLRGYRTASFASAEDFLRAWAPDASGCVIADMRMSGMSGLELQRELHARSIDIPTIILTAHGDVDSARAAFKARAVDFLEKPFDDKVLFAAIEAACGREETRWARHRERQRASEALAALTPREREVMELVVEGQHNREIGLRLGISARTVEVHKARVMDKLGARTLADLIRISRAGL